MLCIVIDLRKLDILEGPLYFLISDTIYYFEGSPNNSARSSNTFVISLFLSYRIANSICES